MSAALPDYPRSRAILIGTSVYHDKRFRQPPAARNSLNGVKEILVDEQLCGWPEEVSLRQVSADRQPGRDQGSHP
jgi:hypothetical protein